MLKARNPNLRPSTSPEMEQSGINTQRRFESLQGLRGVAALAVLLFHLRGVEVKYLGGPALLGDLARYADAGVDLFFVISGFVMSTIAVHRCGRWNDSARFLLKRAWRVLPLYWFFTSLVVLLMMWIPSMVNSSYSGQSVFASYLLIPHAQLPILSVGWTLIHEAYFYLVFAIAIGFVSKRLLPAYLFAWAAMIATAQLMPATTAPTYNLVINPLTYEFIAGAMLGIYWRKLPSWLGTPLLVSGASLAIAGAVILPVEGPASLDVWTRVAWFGSASVLLVAGGVTLEARSHFFRQTWLSRTGDVSYALYLSHIFVISAMGRAWALLAMPSGMAGHLCFVAVTTLTCLAIAHVTHRWIEQPLLALPHRARVIFARRLDN